MQAQRRVLQILFSAAMLAVVIGCAGNSQKESTGEYVDDSWITSKIKAAFVKDSELKASEIGVETHKGTVKLSGIVADAGEVQHAADVAAGIKGVTAVKNDIRVK